MDRREYLDLYEELLRDGYSENSPEVQRLNEMRLQAMGVERLGNPNINVSNQASQGPLAKPVNPLSDEDKDEANWMAQQLAKEENRTMFKTIRNITDDPDNWHTGEEPEPYDHFDE